MSQQGVQFTQYMFNQIYYNPGVSGSGGAICANLVHRSQWVGFEGAPTTQNFNLNAPIQKLHGGLSLSVANDQIGFFQNIDFGVAYAYQLQLSNGTLGIGVGLNLRNKALDDAQWVPSENDFTDPSLAAGDASALSFNPSFGVYYESSTLWAGVSTTNLTQSTAELNSVRNTVIEYTNARHFYIMGGYNWEIPATNWVLMPSTLIKTDLNSSPSLDVNLMGMYNNKIWGGVTYRLQDAIAVNVAYQILPAWRLGYSYDVGTSTLATQGSSGSHEIMLRYCFKIEIPPRQKGSYRNPRFL
jgi:type IX secretion system PorP/SprF family membrane protein